MFYHVALSGLKIIRSSALVVQISLEMNFSRTIIVHSFPVSATHLLLFSTSVTRLGDFRKLFESRLLYKISQNVWWLFASSKTSTFEVKTALLLLGNFLENFGLLSISTFGHTGLPTLLFCLSNFWARHRSFSDRNEHARTSTTKHFKLNSDAVAKAVHCDCINPTSHAVIVFLFHHLKFFQVVITFIYMSYFCIF